MGIRVLRATAHPVLSRPDITDCLSAHLDSLSAGEEDKEWCLRLFFFLSFFRIHERLPAGEDNIASEPLSRAPGDVVPTLTMIGSVQPESYVTVRALSTLA